MLTLNRKSGINIRTDTMTIIANSLLILRRFQNILYNMTSYFDTAKNIA